MRASTLGILGSRSKMRCLKVCRMLRYLSRVCWAMGSENFLTRRKRSRKLASVGHGTVVGNRKQTGHEVVGAATGSILAPWHFPAQLA